MLTGLMSTIVTKSSPVVVGPATSPATPTVEHIKLSSFDKALAFSPFTSFLVFDHAIHEPAETVRSALSRALVHYFPVAGRAVVGARRCLRRGAAKLRHVIDAVTYHVQIVGGSL
jgi:hypothetical protein